MITDQQEHDPKLGTSCLHCSNWFRFWDLFRCFDCKGWLCAICMPGHFGNQHEPHPLHLPQWQEKLDAFLLAQRAAEEKYRLVSAQHARLCDEVYEEDGETLKHVTAEIALVEFRERAAKQEHVAWCRYFHGVLSLCNYDSPDAFKVYKALPVLPTPDLFAANMDAAINAAQREKKDD